MMPTHKETHALKSETEDLGFEAAFAQNFMEPLGSARDEEIEDHAFNILSMRKGGFFRRLLAFNADLSLQALSFLSFFFIGFYTLQQREFLSGSSLSGSDIGRMLAPLFFITGFINAGYFIFFHWATGQTPGKKLFSLKVVDKRGNPPGFWKSVLRWVGYYFSSLFFMAGYLMALVDRQNQALHDKMAGTYVIDSRGDARGMG